MNVSVTPVQEVVNKDEGGKYRPNVFLDEVVLSGYVKFSGKDAKFQLRCDVKLKAKDSDGYILLKPRGSPKVLKYFTYVGPRGATLSHMALLLAVTTSVEKAIPAESSCKLAQIHLNSELFVN